MKSEEQFKESLNELLESKTFSFEESNWTEARQVIDASRKRKKRAILLFFSGLLFLSIGVVSYFIFQPTRIRVQASPTMSEGNLSSTNATPSVIENTEVISGSGKNKSPETGVEEATSEPISTGRMEVTLKKMTPTSNGVNHEPPQTPGNTTKFVANTPNPVMGNQGTKVLSSAPNSPVIVAPPASLIPPSGTEKPAEEINMSPQVAASVPITRESEKSLGAIESTVSITPTIPGTLMAMEPLTDNSVVFNKTSDSLAKRSEETNPAATNSIPSSAVAKPDTDYVRGKKPTLLVEAGVSYLLGWKTSEHKEASGLNPVLGINYLTSISPLLSLGFGIQYSSVGQLTYNSYTSKVSKLNFGEESDVTVYTPTTLHYLIVPMRLLYKLDQKNSIGLGCNIGYLLTVSGTIEKYSETIQGRSEIQSSKSIGYSQGFKPFDAQLAAFYQRKLYKNYYGKVEFFYGINSVKDATLFQSSSASRNVGFKFTLVYDIFKNY
ncbi:MAG: hypothetical protein PSX36_14975 [bacterium]|nr:hypothetical protein [bacterium]